VNPWHLSVTELLVWAIVAHVVTDWLAQNDWMATGKAQRRPLPDPSRAGIHRVGRWYDRHPAWWVHTAITAIGACAVFGWPGLVVALAHGLIDTRAPVAAWMAALKQTLPQHPPIFSQVTSSMSVTGTWGSFRPVDVGIIVAMAVDQAFHLVTLAIAALVVG
jgi:hypothetical protein